MYQLNEMGMPGFGQDPTFSLVTEQQLIKEAVVAAIAPLLGAKATPIPMLNSGMSAADAARSFYVTTPAFKSAQDNLVLDYARRSLDTLGRSPAMGSLGITPKIADLQAALAGGNSGATTAALLSLQTALAIPTTQAAMGGNILQMGELAFRNRDVFARYNGYDKGRVFSAWDPADQIELAERANTFSQSLSQAIRPSGLLRDRGFTGNFRDEDVVTLLTDGMRRGMTGAVTRVRRDEQDQVGMDVVDYGGARAQMEMWNSISEVMGTRDVGSLMSIADKLSRGDFSKLDPQQVKQAFDKVKHFAKTLNVSADGMVEAAAAINETVANQKGYGLGFTASSEIVQRGLSRAAQMGITDAKARSGVVAQEATISAEALDSSAGRALIQLQANSSLLTDAERAWVFDMSMAKDPNSLLTLHRRLMGGKSAAMLRDTDYTRSALSALSETQRAQVSTQAAMGYRYQRHIDALTASADQGGGAARRLRALVADDNDPIADEANAVMLALEGEQVIFSGDAKTEGEARTALRDAISAGRGKGLSDSDAVRQALSLFKDDAVIGGGLATLRRHASLRLAQKTLAETSPTAAMYSQLKETAAASNINVDDDKFEALVKASNWTKLDAMFSTALGGDAVLGRAKANATDKVQRLFKPLQQQLALASFTQSYGSRDAAEDAFLGLSDAMNTLQDISTGNGLPTTEDMRKLATSLEAVHGVNAAHDTMSKLGMQIGTDGRWSTSDTAESVKERSSAALDRYKSTYGLALAGWKAAEISGARGGDIGDRRRERFSGEEINASVRAMREPELRLLRQITDANPQLSLSESLMSLLVTGDTNSVAAHFGFQLERDDSGALAKQKKALQKQLASAGNVQAFFKDMGEARSETEKADVIKRHQGNFTAMSEELQRLEVGSAALPDLNRDRGFDVAKSESCTATEAKGGGRGSGGGSSHITGVLTLRSDGKYDLIGSRND